MVWRTFSLKEANRDPASSSPLAVPKAESVSVLALALAHAARVAGCDRYHRAVFRAMHEEQCAS